MPTFTPQPTSMENDNGMILTIGLQVNGDKCAIVIPLGTDTAIDRNSSAFDLLTACEGLGAFPLSDLIVCLSSDVFVDYTQAEGMIDGVIPARKEYPPTAWVGARGAGPAPSQVAGLAIFYKDANDTGSTPERVKLGKNFIPGIASEDIDGDTLVPDVYTAIASFAADLQAGFEDSASPVHHWYRVLSAPRTRASGQPLKRTYLCGSRGYVVTQRRRLIPRG